MRVGTRHLAHAAVAGLGVLALIAGCTVGPSSRPPLDTFGPAEVAASSTPASSARPTGPGGNGQQRPSADWSDCTFDTSQAGSAGTPFAVDCANVLVPRIYGATDNSNFRIRMARARAEGLPADAPTLLVVDGMPAQNGSTRVAEIARALPAEITQKYAVVVPDLRGTGSSSPLRCLQSNAAQALLALPDPRTAAAQIDELAKAVTLNCSAEAESNLTRYNVTSAADDLDSLRSALGADTLNLLGTGFGATLGAVYATRYPGRVGRLVLDSPGNPLAASADAAASSAAAAEEALKAFAAQCQTFAGGCPLGPDPVGVLQNLVKSLNDSGTQTDDGQPLTGETVLLMVLQALGAEATWPDLAKALAALRDGDPNAAGTLLAGFLTDDPTGFVTAALIYSCNDTGQRLTGNALAQAATTAADKAPTFGALLIGLLGLCGSWPSPESPVSKLSATGAPPIMVLGSSGDPISSFSGVQTVSGQLASAVLVTWQSSQHGSYPASSCITSQVNAYLLSGSPPSAGTLCPP